MDLEGIVLKLYNFVIFLVNVIKDLVAGVSGGSTTTEG